MDHLKQINISVFLSYLWSKILQIVFRLSSRLTPILQTFGSFPSLWTVRNCLLPNIQHFYRFVSNVKSSSTVVYNSFLNFFLVGLLFLTYILYVVPDSHYYHMPLHTEYSHLFENNIDKPFLFIYSWFEYSVIYFEKKR